MKKTYTLIVSMILLTIVMTETCNSSKSNILDSFIGVWKVDNREQYESWEKISETELQGEGYVIKNGSKVVTESLSIKCEKELVIYSATVANQNEGKPVQFTLNQSDTIWYSFENLSHDFPTKIRYKFVENDKIQVEVLGADDKGFTLAFTKQK